MATIKSINPRRVIRLGTRTSQLALWQTKYVVAQLQRHWSEVQFDLVHIVTQGDKRLDRPLPEIGGKGLFTAELEEALRTGAIDLAVHSLKDLPVEESDEIIIGAILSREDPRDVLVAREQWTLMTLPQGAVVGTSSLRRQAQILALRPDLQIRSIRGNVDTRLRKVMDREYDAAVMAGAGLTRLGLTDSIQEWLSAEAMLPAPGQGALAVQCRADDQVAHFLLEAIHDAQTAAETTAERLLLSAVGGGCSAPVGAWAQSDGVGLELRARIVSVDGRQQFDASAKAQDAVELAHTVAESLLSQGALTALERSTNKAVLPLQDKKIVISRPREQSREMAEAVEHLGATAIEIPVFENQEVPHGQEVESLIRKAAEFDWLIFTSATAVDLFFRMVDGDVMALDSERTKVAAVGPVTQKALVAKGIHVDVVPEKFLGVEIARVLGDLDGKQVLLPRSAQGSQDLPDALTANGARVKDLPIYKPVSIPMNEQARSILISGVDVVTFASGSAVRAFVDSLKGDQRFNDFWSKVIVACIGPSTANVAKAEGIPVHVTATEHTALGLVNALVTYFESRAKLWSN